MYETGKDDVHEDAAEVSQRDNSLAVQDNEVHETKTN